MNIKRKDILTEPPKGYEPTCVLVLAIASVTKSMLVQLWKSTVEGEGDVWVKVPDVTIV